MCNAVLRGCLDFCGVTSWDDLHLHHNTVVNFLMGVINEGRGHSTCVDSNVIEIGDVIQKESIVFVAG